VTERRLQVLALVPYPLREAPGQRYRIEQWAPYLSDWGIDVHFQPFADAELGRTLYQRGHYAAKALAMTRAWLGMIGPTWRSSGFDVVYIHREAALVGPAWLERLAHRRNPALVYDFDDAIWLRYVSPRNRYLAYLKAPGKTKTICRMASAITVGNETLAAFARRYNPAVTVVPSTVSLRAYRPRPQAPQARPDPIPAIGWTGSHSSVQYLRLVEGALQTLARRRRFRLVVIGVEDYALEGVDVECRPWREATEVEDLWSFDVGIMPLFDDPWASGKCAMKAIQYMGVGLPAVVSPVGANRDVVPDGACGFHASSADDWVSTLDRLLDSPVLRARLGEEARRRVEALFSAEVQAPRVADLLWSLNR
jgi:glycosyltransferase involved in cell wall biosynthesis